MAPATGLWLWFEINALIGARLVDGAMRFPVWLSRLAVFATIATFLYQLWLINYAESTERQIKATPE